MKGKIAALLIVIGIVMTFGGVLAAQWYYSNTVSTTSVAYILTISSIDPETPINATIPISGTVMEGSDPSVGDSVFLFENIDSIGWANTGLSAVTDGSGNFLINYVNDNPADAVVELRAGVQH